MTFLSDSDPKLGIILAEPQNRFAMKKTALVISATLALALAFAACEKPAVAPEPAATTNPLIGTNWLYHHDTTIMGIHVVQELRLAFLTDTTGEDYIGGCDTYSPWWDTTYAFTYIFHRDVSGVELYEDGSHLASYYRYHPESQTLTQPGIVFHLVEK